MQRKCEVKKVMKQMIEKLEEAVDKISNKQVEKLIEEIQRAKKIFIMGAGRSGLVGRAFAMRLMHLGFNVYVVGETVTPSLEPEDLVIAVSGSGSTKSIAEWAEIAKQVKARLAAITANPDSRIGRIADVAVVLPVKTKERVEKGYVERQLLGEHKSLAPLGTMFELTAMLFLDGLIAELMLRLNKSEEDLKLRHTILE
ncbi:MAG: 6-phospho-3-hexuloisomerase [Methanocellales archaeon]